MRTFKKSLYAHLWIIYLLADILMTVHRRLSAELNLDELLRGNRERFLNLASANPQIIDCVSGDTLTFAFLQPYYSIHISQPCGSGIRCLFDPGSWIPDPEPIFLRALWQFFGNLAKKFSSPFQNKMILNFFDISGYKKRYNKFVHPSLLLLFLDPGSEIRDPGWTKNRIRDPG